MVNNHGFLTRTHQQDSKKIISQPKTKQAIKEAEKLIKNQGKVN